MRVILKTTRCLCNRPDFKERKRKGNSAWLVGKIQAFCCWPYRYELSICHRKEEAEIIKTERAETRIVLGGYHATVMYDEFGEDISFDFLIRGEGDLSFNELLVAIDGKMEKESIKGLSFTHKGTLIHNPPQPIENLDKIALPARTERI